MQISGVGGPDGSTSAEPLQVWQQLLHRPPEPSTAATDRSEPVVAAQPGPSDQVGAPRRQPEAAPADPEPSPALEDLAARAIGKLVNLSADEVLQRLRDGVRLDRLLAENGVTPADLAAALDHFLAGHRRLDLMA